MVHAKSMKDVVENSNCTHKLYHSGHSINCVFHCMNDVFFFWRKSLSSFPMLPRGSDTDTEPRSSRSRRLAFERPINLSSALK
jgi:hypothetical protein